MRPVDQPDLFGTPKPPAPAAYVIPYPIAVNTLRRTLEQLTAAAAWPWDRDMKAAKMDCGVPKLLAVLPPDEAEHWRVLIPAEWVRLDAV